MAKLRDDGCIEMEDGRVLCGSDRILTVDDFCELLPIISYLCPSPEVTELALRVRGVGFPAGGGGGSRGPAGQRGFQGAQGIQGAAGSGEMDIQFGQSTQVPGDGILQLLAPGESEAGTRVYRAGTITCAAIQVDMVDPDNSFNLSIRVNGVEVGTLLLPAGSLGAQTCSLAIPVVPGDVVTTFLVRVDGQSASTFSNETALIGIF